MEKLWTRASDMLVFLLAVQLRVQLDRLHGRQGLRDRAALLRGLRGLLEGALVQTGCADARAQLDALDREALVDLLEVNGGVGLHRVHLVAGLAQLAGKRHRVAAGVCCRDQLLGVRSVALLESRLERVRPLVGAAAHPHRPLALGQRPVPHGACGPLRHRRSPLSKRVRPKDRAQWHPMDDPLARFREWLEEARAELGYDADAMAVATATPDGVPSVRM